jgi:lipopolysaccharide biosynthesis protein
MTARRASYYEAWNAAAVYHDFGLMYKAHAPSGPSASMLWFLQAALQPSSPRTLHLRAFPSTGDKQRFTTLRHKKNLQDLHTGKARYASPLHTSYRPGSGGSDIACGSHHNSFLPGKPLTRYKMPVLHDLD